MTIDVVARTVAYTGNGASTLFSIPFQFYEGGVDVRVGGELQSAGADYSLIQLENGQTGSCLFVEPPPTGAAVTISGNTSPRQTVDLVDAGSFPAEAIELALDRLYASMQEQTGNLGTSLRVPPGAPAPGPIDLSQEGRLLVAKDNGIATYVPSAIGYAFFDGSGDLTVTQTLETAIASITAVGMRHTASSTGFILPASNDPTLGGLDTRVGTLEIQIDQRVPTAGGSMTGALTLPGSPTNGLHATTKSYVDSAVGSRLPTSGGTMTGAITLPGSPTNGLHAATKQYVDSVAANLVGLAPNNLDTLDKLAAAIGDNPLFAASVNGDIAARLPLSGGTMSGFLTLSANPTANLHAVTKQYVDALIDGATGGISTNLAVGTNNATHLQVTSSTGTNVTLTGATTTLAGLLVGADKTKLTHIAVTQAVNLDTMEARSNAIAGATAQGL